MISSTTHRAIVAEPLAGAAVRPAQRTESTRPRLLVAAMGGLGGALTVTGAVAPWLSLYAGLEQFRGTSGSNGLILVALGVVSILVSAVHLARGGAVTRWLLGATGFAMLALGGWLGIQLVQTFSALSADPLLVARIEPGLGIALGGASLVFATLFAPAGRGAVVQSRRNPLSTSHVVLATLVAVAGAIHVILAPEHLAESMLLGIGFIGAGVAQLVAAAYLLRTRASGALVAVLVVSLGSLVALAAAVTVGLPFLAHGESMGPLGPVEPLDDLAAITGLAELIAVVLAVRLVRPTGGRPPQGSELPAS